MAYHLIPCDRDQMLFLPPSLKDWLFPDHPVWVVIQAIASMDLSPFYQDYRADDWWAAAFESGMVTLLLYGYRPPVNSPAEYAPPARSPKPAISGVYAGEH